MPKDDRQEIHLYLSKSIKERVEKIATAQMRSINNQVTLLLLKGLEAEEKPDAR